MEKPNMQLEDWLDDLCVRFIINLPEQDLKTVPRICFQVEEAQWFYEDFIRPLDPNLPTLNLRSFMLLMFQHCPLLAPFSVEHHMKAFEDFMQYKTRVPVRGAIMLNEAMDSTVLVKGWKKSASWSFPRGKINKDEDDMECAIREVYEETGLNLRDAGLVPEGDDVKHIEVTMREQQLRLYVFRNVPMDTYFEPRTRKEISKIEWYKLSELPAFRKKGNTRESEAAAATNANKFYMVAPFLVPLKKWVKQIQKREDMLHNRHGHLSAQPIPEELMTEEEGLTTTAPVAEPSSQPPAIDTIEGMNRELQRRLEIQPPTQGLQAPALSQGQDKGGALLAMLQLKNEGTSQQSIPQPSHQVPHTPSDLMHNSVPEPQAPHYHHTTQRLPPFTHQAPPSFPIQPSMNQNVTATYGNQARPPMQIMQRQPSMDLNFAANYGNQGRPPVQIIQRQPGNPQPSFTMQPRPPHQPVLVHPQPLPRQANHLLAGAMPPAQQGVPNGTNYGNQQANVIGQAGGLRDVSSQHIHNPAQQPVALDSHRQNLLKAFGNNEVQAREAERNNPLKEPPPAAARRPSQQQPINWAPLASTYATQPTSSLPGQNGKQPVHANGSPNMLAAQAALKAPLAPEAQRKALLDMFKPSTAVSPVQNAAQVGVKDQNAIGLTTQRAPQYPPSGCSSTAQTNMVAAQANGGPAHINQIKFPFDGLSLLNRPQQSDENAHQRRVAAQPIRNSPIRNSPKPNPALSPGREDIRNSYTGRAPQSIPFTGLPYTNSTYMGLPSPSAASSIPSVLPRRQETNSEQQQKLMSLFSGPAAQQAGPFAHDKGKGKEPALGRLPTPGSHAGSFATAPGNGANGGVQMSRRSSQAPISPENETFLLNYLKSFSNAAHH